MWKWDYWRRKPRRRAREMEEYGGDQLKLSVYENATRKRASLNVH